MSSARGRALAAAGRGSSSAAREWEATQWNGPVLALGDGRPAGLGPDLLAPETEPSTIVARLRRVDQSRLVGEALVDQRLVAGIGNMWLAETLWQARVSPWSRLGDVDDDELSGRSPGRETAMRAAVPSVVRAAAVYRRAGRAVRGAASRFDHAVSATRTARRTGARRASRRPIQRRGRDSNPRRADYHP